MSLFMDIKQAVDSIGPWIQSQDPMTMLVLSLMTIPVILFFLARYLFADVFR